MDRCARTLVLGLLLAGVACKPEVAPACKPEVAPACTPEVAPACTPGGVPAYAPAVARPGDPAVPVVLDAAAPVAAGAVTPIMLDAARRKHHRIELLIAQIDPVLHGVRLGYRPDRSNVMPWTWPTHLEPAKLSRLVVELERLAHALPALGPLDAAASRYGRDSLALATELRTIVVGSGQAEADPGAAPPPPPRAEVVQPLFARMRAGSHAIHAALRAAAPRPGAPLGPWLTLERRCLEAAEVLVDVPSSVAEAPAGAAEAVDLEELRRRARACTAAAIDLLDTGNNVYHADLGLGVGTSLLREVARLRDGGAVSWGGNLGQSMQYLAAQGVAGLDALP